MSNKKVRFNGMDLFIVIALVIVIAAGIYVLFGRSGGAAVSNAKGAEVTVTAELTAQDKEFCEFVKVGDIVMIGEKTKLETVVTAVEVVPAKETGYDIMTGRILRSEVPERYDVRVTLVGKGTETDSAVEINGTAIRVGEKTVFGSKSWAGEGYVIGLETAELN